MLNLYHTNNPYLSSARVDNETGEVIIEYAADQLWVDPDTNEQQVLTGYWDERIKDEGTTDQIFSNL